MRKKSLRMQGSFNPQIPMILSRVNRYEMQHVELALEFCISKPKSPQILITIDNGNISSVSSESVIILSDMVNYNQSCNKESFGFTPCQTFVLALYQGGLSLSQLKQIRGYKWSSVKIDGCQWRVQLNYNRQISIFPQPHNFPESHTSLSPSHFSIEGLHGSFLIISHPVVNQ